jgi:splicing factor U2AF subunit
MAQNKEQNELVLKESDKSNAKTQLVLKSDQNSSIVRSNLYNTDLVDYGVYKNFNYVDISTIPNLSKKFIIYNLPDVNDDEIKDFLITLLNSLSPNINTYKSLNPIISFDKRDSGEYYIIEVERHEQVLIMKNLDGIEWLNHRIRIESPKDFFKDYNDTKGQIAIRQRINESKLFSNLAQDNLNKNNNTNNKYNYNRLLMTGLPYNIEEKEVKKIVESYGQIKYFNLINKKNSDEISYTLCFFEYELPQNTYKALKGLNNMTFADRQLKVQRINNNPEKDDINDNDLYNENNNGLKNATIATKILKEAKQMEEIKKNEKELNNFLNKNKDNINKEAENNNKEETVFKDLNEGNDVDKNNKNKITYNDLTIPEFARIPSRVVMFINAVSPEDLLDDSDYEEIIDDFRQKCSVYGTVLNVEIPRPNIEEGTYTDDVGKIFIKFSTLKTAKIARYNISGLKYNNRLIVGSFYPESYFDIREYNHNEI